VIEHEGVVNLRSQIVISNVVHVFYQLVTNMRFQIGTASGPRGSATELRGRVRSKMEFGNDGDGE